jgi:hypothetical protein
MDILMINILSFARFPVLVGLVLGTSLTCHAQSIGYDRGVQSTAQTWNQIELSRQQAENLRLQNEALQRQQQQPQQQQTIPPEVLKWLSDNLWLQKDTPQSKFAAQQVNELKAKFPNMSPVSILDLTKLAVQAKFGNLGD